MKLGNTAKSLLTAGMIALSGAEAKGQVVLDHTEPTAQTIQGISQQIYKTIAFANGDINNDPSHNYIGPKNFQRSSSTQGGTIYFWRPDTNNPSNTEGFFTRITGDAPTFPPHIPNDTVGGNPITWQDAKKSIIYPKTGTDSDGNSLNAMNLNPNLRMEETVARADTNNDPNRVSDPMDAQLMTYTLPTGQDAIAAGFQEGDYAIFETPSLNDENGFSILVYVPSHKILVRDNNNVLVRRDTLPHEYPTASGLNQHQGHPDRDPNPLSTKEVINNSQITVYPNPTTDYISIQLGTGLRKIEGYTLYTSDGRQALTGKLSGTDTKIDVQTLPAGVYFLHLIIDGKQTTQKIIKQ